jgi:hypothetical protein
VAINAEQLREYVIRPALKRVDLWSPAAEDLLLGTAAHESAMGTYIKQIKGPALGIYQIEPATHLDIWENYLKYKTGLRDKIIATIPPMLRNTRQGFERRGEHSMLITDLAYATIMARICYLRAPTALPPEGDLQGYAAYWKQYFNTPLGAGTEQQYAAHFQKYIA